MVSYTDNSFRVDVSCARSHIPVECNKQYVGNIRFGIYIRFPFDIAALNDRLSTVTGMHCSSACARLTIFILCSVGWVWHSEWLANVCIGFVENVFQRQLLLRVAVVRHTIYTSNNNKDRRTFNGERREKKKIAHKTA